MRTKKTFSFDEEKDAEKVIVEGFPNGVLDYGKIYLVAKYFRQKFDYGEIRLERELVRFCKKWDENFNSVKESIQLRKWIRSAMNYDLRKTGGVDISQTEIDFLKTIQPGRDRKLLFVTLVLSKALKKGSTRKSKSDSKASDNHYVRNNNFTDIIRLSKLKNITDIQLAEIFHSHKELFVLYSPERELIQLKFASTNPKDSIFLENLDKLLEYYELLIESKGNTKSAFFCEKCGLESEKTNNNQKYCEKCAKTIRRENQKKLMRKRRAS